MSVRAVKLWLKVVCMFVENYLRGLIKVKNTCLGKLLGRIRENVQNVKMFSKRQSDLILFIFSITASWLAF